MQPRFKNKVVLITGAGSGIGQAAAVAFAREGARVAVADISPKAADETVKLVKKAKGKAASLAGDVSRAEDCERMVAGAVKLFGDLDILCNNAGIGVAGNAVTTSEQQFDDIMRVNVKGTFLLSKEVLTKVFLPKKKGVIVNTASTAGLRGIFDRTAYTASKHAIVGLTRGMAVDHVKDGVRVNCICPGTTMTPWIDKRLKEAADPKAALATLVARQPMGRLGTAEEMAAGILYLASDDAAFATGSALIVDGGYCA
ncbi:MAG TPA: glucose 1-dehydrogenase [Polyangia bacterium]|jgi:NAD(P)-dependent dehydrogenase (short-subunit alcohol dehydrogenase family)|nr:glucose 1-dehydrogenase [Polyangia bacterium]